MRPCSASTPASLTAPTQLSYRTGSTSYSVSLIQFTPAPPAVLCWLQEKRSAYAPSEETPVRYDGIYRIAKCWRKPGEQKFLICRWVGRV